MVKPDYNANRLKWQHYMRYVPAKLGFINYGAFVLQINKIQPADVFLVSYPKSGNTWLRYIVATALHGRSNFSFQELENIVPDVYLSKTKINASGNNRIIKTHHPLFKYYPKTVYVYRNIFDVMVSYYHYAVNAKQFTGNLSQFVKSNYHSRYFGSWQQNIQAALDAKENGYNIHILSYENLLQNTASEVEKILNFMGIIPTIQISEIVKMCDFNTLQKTEKEKGSYFGNELLFFREGKNSLGRNELSETDKNYLLNDKSTHLLMKKLGYIN